MNGDHDFRLALEPAERLYELAWLQTMGLPVAPDRLPATAESLDTIGRRNSARTANARNAQSAAVHAARELGRCRHCGAPAAGWTLTDDGTPDTRVPLCPTCDDDSWVLGTCADPYCGRNIERTTCAAVEL